MGKEASHKCCQVAKTDPRKTSKGKLRRPQNIKRAMEESCFWEMYVPKALGYLTFNINANEDLASGIPIKKPLHFVWR